VAIGLALAASLGCGGVEPASALSYVERIEQDRRAKDEMFLTASDSPLLADRREEFMPLAYFPVEPAYHVAAALKVGDVEPAIRMPTSTGLLRPMRRAGRLQFSINGRPYELTAFVEAGDRAMARLFVPFGDLTNGTESYAAGRYLDLDRTASGLYDLDFNRAYHPYCYYNPTYDCPYPPAENRLRTPIRAGERMRSAGTD
jgi:hypothetical protein